MKFELPALPFEQDALEPHISKETVHYHYDKHHAGYLSQLGDALADDKRRYLSLEEIISDAHKNEDATVFNPAAQVYNHNLYWDSISPDVSQRPSAEAKRAIGKDFGSVDAFKSEFRKKATGQFGSGWAWLVYDPSTKAMKVITTSDAMTPLVLGLEPIVTLDVWEHAYYIDYRNERAKYIDTYLESLINWDRVARRIEDLPIAA